MKTNGEPEFDPALEQELRQARPASDVLVARLEMALVEDAGVVNPQPIPAWRQWIAPTAGLAALLVALPRQPATQNSPDAANPGMNKVLPHAAAALIPPQTEAPKSLDLKPVAMENRVVGAVDDGVFNTPDQHPMRRVRMQVVDSYTWESKDGATTINYTVPREEHFLIPLAIH